MNFMDLADLAGLAHLTGLADLTPTLTADRKDVPHP
jgi:hypothetical protein